MTVRDRPARGWVLVDTSAIFGIFMENDQRHTSAMEALGELRDARKRLLTTTDVFSETVTALRRWAGHNPQ